MSDKLAEFNQDILEEVVSYRTNNIVSTSVAFKTIFLSYLADIGESSISDCQIIDFKKSSNKMRLDGYVFNEYFNTLTLIVSDFSPSPQIVKTGKVEIEKTIKQAHRFLKNCTLKKSRNQVMDIKRMNIFKHVKMISKPQI